MGDMANRSYEEWVEVVIEELRKRVVAMRWDKKEEEDLLGQVRLAFESEPFEQRYDPSTRTDEEAVVIADSVIATHDRQKRLEVAAVNGAVDAIDDILREVPPDDKDDLAASMFFVNACGGADNMPRPTEAEPIPYDEWVDITIRRARARLTPKELETTMGSRLDETVRQALVPMQKDSSMWNAEEAEVLAITHACSCVRRCRSAAALDKINMRAVYSIMGWMSGQERLDTCTDIVRRGLPIVLTDGRSAVKAFAIATLGSMGEFINKVVRELRGRVTTAELEEATQVGLDGLHQRYPGRLRAPTAAVDR